VFNIVYLPEAKEIALGGDDYDILDFEIPKAAFFKS
jgi:hypothetical protein